MSQVEFNINETVLVKLTETGINILKQQHDELRKHFPKMPEFTPPKKDKDGWSKFQLWSLMEYLGEHCGMCKQNPFETNIKFIVNDKGTKAREALDKE